MRFAGLTVIACMSLLPACSDSGSGPSGCTPSATQICMNAASYNPTTLTVTSGATVTWRDGSGIAHTVTSNAGAPEAFNANVAAGGTFSRQFNTPGTYAYHCAIHAPMTGTLTVNP